MLSAAAASSAVEAVWRSLELTRHGRSADVSSIAIVVIGPPAARDALAAALGTSGPTIAMAGDRCGGLEALHVACRCLQAGDCETAVVVVADGTIAMVLARADTVELDGTPAAAWIDVCVWAAPETAAATAWELAGGNAGPLRAVRLDAADGGLAGLVREVAANHAEGSVAYVAPAPDGRQAICAVLRPDRGCDALAALAGPSVGSPPSTLTTPGGDRPSHPVLGMRLPSPLREIQFGARIGPDTHSWTADHRVFSTPILPAAAMIEMMIAAAIAGLGWPDNEVVLRDLHFRRALPFAGEDATAMVATVLTPVGEHRFEAAIHGRTVGRQEWTLHAIGILERATAPLPVPIDIRALRRGLGDEMPLADHFAGNAARGIVYGPAFQGVSFLCRGRRRAVALLRRPPAATGDGHLIHPALLDAAIQVVPAAFETPPEGAYVPVAMAEARLGGAIPDELWCEATARGAGNEGRTRVADIRLFAPDGSMVASIRNIELILTDAETMARNAAESDDEPPSRQAAEAENVEAPASLGDLFPAERRARLVRVVHDACVAILGLPADASIDRSAGFFTIGFDSMAAVDLHRRLQPSLGIDFPATAVFDHSSVAALADYLNGRFAMADERPVVPPRSEPSLKAAVEAMSAEEAEAELLQEIDKSFG